jgi:hypothetical protein
MAGEGGGGGGSDVHLIATLVLWVWLCIDGTTLVLGLSVYQVWNVQLHIRYQSPGSLSWLAGTLSCVALAVSRASSLSLGAYRCFPRLDASAALVHHTPQRHSCSGGRPRRTLCAAIGRLEIRALLLAHKEPHGGTDAQEAEHTADRAADDRAVSAVERGERAARFLQPRCIRTEREMR